MWQVLATVIAKYDNTSLQQVSVVRKCDNSTLKQKK